MYFCLKRSAVNQTNALYYRKGKALQILIAKLGTKASKVIISICLPLIQPLIPTLGYCGLILYSTLGHMGGGNSCGGHTPMRVAKTQVG